MPIAEFEATMTGLLVGDVAGEDSRDARSENPL
jgi:hypothetical protein